MQVVRGPGHLAHWHTMDLLLLVLVIAVFILPSFLMMRSQRRRQAELQSMQSALGVGDRVVTVAGIHGTIVTAGETQVEVEIAPGVVATMDRIAIMRRATPEDLGSVAGGTPATGEQVGYRHPDPQFPEHPENTTDFPDYPDFPDHPENRPDGGHPENR